MTKDEYKIRIQHYISAFESVAEILGKNHPMTKLMGGLAWGRHDAKRGPSSQGVKAHAIEYGFLWGCERMLVKWCNANNQAAARDLLLNTLMELRS